MADAEKRLRYFNGQLLDQEDFRDEQAYNLDRLRRHNRQLHTPGIAEGLTVDAPIGAAEVTVQPGTALDAQGHQIVLAAARTVPLAEHAGDTVLVVISFAEEAADPSGLGSGTETRWLEKPAVAAVSELSAPASGTHLRLARLTVAGDGTVAAAPDLAVRVAAGAGIGDEVSVRRLTLEREGVGASSWPAVSAGAAGRLDIQGDLSVSGQIDGRDVAADGAGLDAHLADAGNPHGVTAAQTGALASVGGVANPGGDVGLVAAGAITLTPDDAQNRVTVGESHSIRTDNPHSVTAAQAGALPASGGTIDGDLQVGATGTSIRRLTVYGPDSSSSVDGALVVRVASSTTRLRLDRDDIDCTGNLFVDWYSGNKVYVCASTRPGGLTVYGDLYASGDINAGGSKAGYVSDAFLNGAGKPLEKGDVVVLSGGGVAEHHGRDDDIPVPEVAPATQDHDSRVCGIVTELLVQDEPQVPAAEREAAESKGEKVDDGIKRLQVIPRDQRDKLDRTTIGSGQFGRMVTLGCFAVCKVDADVAPIQVGDLLTTSSTPGHAQKVTDPSRALGAVLGKALGPLAKGTGTIPVLVLLH